MQIFKIFFFMKLLLIPVLFASRMSIILKACHKRLVTIYAKYETCLENWALTKPFVPFKFDDYLI